MTNPQPISANEAGALALIAALYRRAGAQGAGAVIITRDELEAAPLITLRVTDLGVEIREAVGVALNDAPAGGTVEVQMVDSGLEFHRGGPS